MAALCCNHEHGEYTLYSHPQSYTPTPHTPNSPITNLDQQEGHTKDMALAGLKGFHYSPARPRLVRCITQSMAMLLHCVRIECI